jgi:GxxExxY protein
MNTDERRSGGAKYEREPLTDKTIGVFYAVYNELGYGFLESVYENAMVVALKQSGLECEKQVSVPVWFRDVLISDYRADIIVEKKLIIEQKAAKNFEPAFEAQILNYLRATDIETALLLNFGPKPMVKRYSFSNDRKKIGANRRSSAANPS